MLPGARRPRPAASASAPQRMVEIGRALGVRTADELREAAASRRGSATCRASGRRPRRRSLRGARRRDGPRPRRGLHLQPRAGRSSSGIAEALGGVAGRRPAALARPVASELAVVVADDGPDGGARPLRRAAARSSRCSSASRAARGRRHGRRRAGRGSSPRRPDRFGTELVRATGVERVRRGARPLPDARGRGRRLRGARRCRCCRPSCARRLRGEPPPLVELADDPRRPALHTTWSDGKASVLEMAEAARELGYEYLAICDHTRNVRVVPGLDARRRAPPGRGDRGGERAARAVPRPARHRVRHPRRRLARPARRRPRRARLGAGIGPRGPAAVRASS